MNCRARIALLSALIAVAFGATASAAGAHTWSLGSDWAAADTTATAPANPFPDSYGNQGVWGIGYGSGSYTNGPQLTGFTTAAQGDWSDSNFSTSGMRGWRDSQGYSFTDGYYPYVILNKSGSNYDGIWPDGVVETHPAPDNQVTDNRGAVEWVSPVTATISISAEFTSMNSCSGTLDYSVDLQPSGGSLTHLEGGYFPCGGGAASYSNPSVPVQAGDTYYFSVGDGNTGFLSDSTALSITISDAGSTGGSVAWQNDITGSGTQTLKAPEGVTMDGSNVLITDSGNNQLVTSDPNGISLTALSDTSTAFNDPRQAVPAGNNDIVSDSLDTRVEQINASGSPGESGFGSGVSWGLPRGIATTSDGLKVAVADATNNAVYVFDNGGNLQQTLTSGGSTNVTLKGPEGVAFDPSGDVWVADTQNHRVVEYSSAGDELKTLQDDLGNSFYPTGIAVDPNSGNLWVADWQNNQVVEMDQSGSTLMTVTSAGGTNLSGPVTVALDPSSGDLYVADSGNNRVVRYSGAAGPTVYTDGFTNTSTTDIKVQGRVNPEGRSSEYYVQYGTSSDPSSLTQSTAPEPLVDSGGTPYTDTTDHIVDVDVPNLTAGQNYCFRLVASGAGGSGDGQVLCHQTTGPPLPVVATSTPCLTSSCPGGSDVGIDQIHMRGSVDPEGAPTSWYFQITQCPNFDYSSCPGLTSVTNVPASPQALDDRNGQPYTDNATHLVDAVAPEGAGEALRPGTTYYWRLVATNTDTSQSVYDTHIKHATTLTPHTLIDAWYIGASAREEFTSGSPTFDAGSSVPWGWGCTISGQPYGTGIGSCAGTITKPDGTKMGPYSGASGTSVPYLPTDCGGSAKCTYTVSVDALDSWGNESKASYQYYVNPPPPPPAQQKADQQVQTQVVSQWTPSWWDWLFTSHKDFCPVATSCTDKNALAIVWQNGEVTTTNGGQIIAAGSGNLADSSGKQLLVNNPDLFEVVDAQGQLAGIIAAGSGNIIAAGSGNIIAAGSGNFAILGIIAAGSGNIIAAGSGNIIAAGSGNIIAAGSGNIIAAGSGNFSAGLQFDSGLYSSVDYSKIAPTLTSGDLVQSLSGSAGTQLTSDVSLLSSSGSTSLGAVTGPAADIAASRVHKKKVKTIRFASGSVKFRESHQKTLLLLHTTAKGRKLLAGLIKLNRRLHAKHKPLRSVKLLVTDKYKPYHGKTVTLHSTVKITPL